MINIRLTKNERGKAWRALIDIGPVRLITKDPIYEVTAAHVEMLQARGFKFEILSFPLNQTEKRRHAKAD